MASRYALPAPRETTIVEISKRSTLTKESLRDSGKTTIVREDVYHDLNLASFHKSIRSLNQHFKSGAGSTRGFGGGASDTR